ncbi:MAG: TonB-dependent receptor [Opitutaceae bacterium]|nr:TonB-dependent receptor [Opitutaceae bacterium]
MKHRPPSHPGFLTKAAFSIAALVPGSAFAQAIPGADFSDLSLEELIKVEISSLGRKNTALFETPAPGHIVSAEDIARSGAFNLPEALRLVPGVQVSRVDSANYAITIRGFNDSTSNKLLMLMDGRSVYNQLFSGASWNFQEPMLSDVRRIEVQRGPAGTLWGANAVNGVINLVTKNAHSTLGSLVSVTHGDRFNFGLEARHGWNFNPATAARVYIKYQDHDDYGTGSGTGSDGWDYRLAGTRLDWDRPGGGGLTVIAEHRELRVAGTTNQPTLLPPDYFTTYNDDRRTRGTDLSLKWNQPVFSGGHLSVQGSVTHGDTDQFATGERHTTADIDTQLTLHPLPGHEVITGLTYRSTSDRLRSTEVFTYRVKAATTSFVGAFAQDEITLLPEVLRLTLGAKVERNSYSGWETQPSARLLWHPTRKQTVWAAVSRAARTPSRSERDITWFAATLPPSPLLPLPLPTKVIALGDPDFSSEHVTAYELGHRYQANRRFSIDTSLFYADYTDMRGLRPQLLPPNLTTFPPHFTYLYTATNNVEGHTYGGELSARWQPADRVRLDASVALVRTSLRQLTPSIEPDASIAGLIGNSPREEYKLHAGWDITTQWSIDAYARRTGALPGSAVPGYTGLEARLAWRPRENYQVELVGRDLLDSRHAEIAGFIIGNGAREIARSVFLRVTFKN